MTLRQLLDELKNVKDEYLDADIYYATGLYKIEPVDKVDVIDEDMFPFIVLRDKKRKRME